MSNLMNIVILNNSTMLHGYVKTEVFSLKSTYGEIKLNASQISYIEYRSRYANGKDMVTTIDGSTLVGDLLPTVIPVEVEGQTLNIPKSDIHFIVLFIGRGEALSSKTKGMLKKASL